MISQVFVYFPHERLGGKIAENALTNEEFLSKGLTKHLVFFVFVFVFFLHFFLKLYVNYQAYQEKWFWLCESYNR